MILVQNFICFVSWDYNALNSLLHSIFTFAWFFKNIVKAELPRRCYGPLLGKIRLKVSYVSWPAAHYKLASIQAVELEIRLYSFLSWSYLKFMCF